MTLRTLIVDDEAIARRRIRRLLAAEDGVHVTGECADGAEALAAIAARRPDLVFLDVQMPELDGFQVLQALPTGTLPAVVFVTAFDQYALQAFDVHAVDYLLKPFTPGRFRAALARVRERLERRQVDASLASLVAGIAARAAYVSRLAVRGAGRVVILDLADVDYLEAADNYVRVHAGRREYLVRDTLAGIEARLDPARFTRIHRGAIVQVDRVTELQPATHGDYRIVLRDGTTLTLTRTWRERLARALGRGAPVDSAGRSG